MWSLFYFVKRNVEKQSHCFCVRMFVTLTAFDLCFYYFKISYEMFMCTLNFDAIFEPFW